ncbi:MAG: enoyl-CoA hydratase/isomerase family protein [Acidimicrobiales bacterium]
MSLEPAPEHFLYETAGPVTTITFNRPHKRNGLDRGVVLELERLVHQVRDDRDCKVLVVTGTGNSFCAGADLTLARDAKDPDERRRIQAEMARVPRVIGRIFDVLAHLDVMTIAAINGYAVGGGWSFALAFDYCVAVEEAEFWVPEVEIGVPFVGLPAVTLTERLGPWLAKEAMIMCRRFSARELAALGVLNRVTPADGLEAAVKEAVDRFLALPFRPSVLTKRGVNAVLYGQRLF